MTAMRTLFFGLLARSTILRQALRSECRRSHPQLGQDDLVQGLLALETCERDLVDAGLDVVGGDDGLDFPRS